MLGSSNHLAMFGTQAGPAMFGSRPDGLPPPALGTPIGVTILSIIAAVARNGVIGRDGGMPWRLPEDLARFRTLTWGKPLIIGRKTFQSIGRALPGRETIVVTRDRSFAASGVTIVHEIDTALDVALTIAGEHGVDEAMIGGGGGIYASTICHADRLYLTCVETEPVDGVHFPAIEPSQWRETARSPRMEGPAGEPYFTFVDFARGRMTARTTR